MSEDPMPTGTDAVRNAVRAAVHADDLATQAAGSDRIQAAATRALAWAAIADQLVYDELHHDIVIDLDQKPVTLAERLAAAREVAPRG